MLFVLGLVFLFGDMALADSYTTSNGKIYHNGNSVNLYGVAWFGFETPDHVVHGLWSRGYKEMIAQMKDLGFNAVRLPFCPETLQNVDILSYIDPNKNPDLVGLKSLQVMDKIIDELNNQHLYILLDHHRPDCLMISELWYTDSYTEEQWIDDLIFLAERYKYVNYFLGIDLKNEPHGRATWGTGNVDTDWNLAAERASQAILEANPDILIFVEGIQENPICSSDINHWWGGNLEPQACYPINIPSNKLVFSPHVYGPDVFRQPYFDDPDFPDNMPFIWETHFGYLTLEGYTIAIGEFGGKYGHLGGDPDDVIWQNSIIDYFILKGICNFFYWCWNPNSGDTGGILQDDWISIWEDKYENLKRLMDACEIPRPKIVVSPDPIDFGDVIVGRQYEITLEIGNEGEADLNVMNITHDLGGALKIEPSPPYDPPITVTPSETTTVTLTFITSAEGSINGTLSIESNDPTSPTEIDILAVAKILLGDLSGDGTVSAYDASLILQFVVGLIAEFPIEGMMRSSPYDIEPRSYKINIPDATVKAGERVQVPIVVNDAKGMQAAGIVVKYDSSILKAIDVMPTSTLSNSYWECNTKRNGEIRFAFASIKPIEGGDKLLILEFEALPNSEGIISPLILDHVKLKESLSITRKNGSITVLPSKSLLLQNYPNPFNPETWIPFKLAQNVNVVIHIYSANGQLVHTITLRNQEAGTYVTKDKAAYWDGRNSFGEKVASGVYFYTLQAGEFSGMRKMVIMK